MRATIDITEAITDAELSELLEIARTQGKTLPQLLVEAARETARRTKESTEPAANSPA